MANKTYLISDSFYKEKYPMHNLTDVTKFYSCQEMEQDTTLRDFLGDNLWGAVFAIAVKETPEAYETEFLSRVQQVMVWYVAQAIEDFDKDRTNDNKVTSILNKRKFSEKRVLDYVSATTSLADIQGDDTEPDRNPYSTSAPYFFR